MLCHHLAKTTRSGTEQPAPLTLESLKDTAAQDFVIVIKDSGLAWA